MGRNRTKAQQLDRIVNVRTGETGTIADTHTETTPKGSPPNYAVIRDTGPKRVVLWKGADVEWEPPSPVRKCARCGEADHHVIACPFGDCGWQLTEEAREVLRKHGLDPRRVPGKTDGEDAYDGIHLWTSASQHVVRQPMRRRVCVLDDVEVDGHEFADDTCVHCGATS